MRQAFRPVHFRFWILECGIRRYTVFLALLLASAGGRARGEPIGPRLGYTSPALGTDALATFSNPAGLGFGKRFSGYWVLAYPDSFFSSDSAKGDNALALGDNGIGFSAEWLGSEMRTSYRQYTLAWGDKINRKLAWGGSYRWISPGGSSLPKAHFWDLGFMARPTSYLSVGLVGRNLNRPEYGGYRLHRALEGGLAVRAYSGKLTLYTNAAISEKEKAKDVKPVFGAEVKPTSWLALRGNADTKGNFGAGAGFTFGKFGFGGFNRFDSSAKSRGGVGYVALLPREEAPVIGKRWLQLNLNGDIVDEKPGWSLLGGGARQTTKSLLDLLRKAKEDPSIPGLVLRIEGYGAGWAKTQEIREALSAFRAKGKKIVCYSEMLDNKEYYLASTADQVVLCPAGYLNLTGLKAEIPFIKGTLDKLGIQAELEKRGKYKAAAELVTSDTMSTAFREVENAILDDLYDQMTSGLAQSRKLTQDEVKARIDQGPYMAKEAKEAGLVDTLLYYDQVDSLIQKLWGEKPRKIGEKAYPREEQEEDAWGEPPAIAVIYASGDIMMGQSFTDPLTGMKVMGGNTVAAALKQAREEKCVKAIVFRVDSPGGDGLASDLIWHEVVRCREKKKPVVVSMADVAGSGGYYIACAADTIFAMPGTVTGSIGVITGKVNTKGLYDKLGVKKEVMIRGANADFYSTYRRFTDKQREQLSRQIEADYRDFVHKVAQGRHKSDDEIHAIAQGRVWTGKQAVRNGLVDRLGGFDEAIACAKRMAKIPEGKKVRIVTLPRGKGWFNLPLTQSLSQYKELRDAAKTLEEVRRVQDSPILYRMPPEMAVP